MTRSGEEMTPDEAPVEPAPNNSIVEVAALAQVSTATVSRVMSGRRRKNDDITKRVRQAAATLHYSGNSAAKALRSKVSNIVGVVAPGPMDLFSTRMVSELEPAANALGKNLLITLAAGQEDQDQRIQSLAGQGVDALIVIAAQQPDKTTSLRKLSTPISTIQLCGHDSSSQIDWVGIDASLAMHEAVAHLADRNATSIAFLSPRLDSDRVSDALVEFQSSDQITGLIREPGWTTFGECTIQRGYNDTLLMFSNKSPRPNGIICANDQVALGSLQALQHLSIHVPEQVGIVSLSDSPLAQMASPQITSLQAPYQAIASEALHLALLEEPSGHLPHAHTGFPPRLIQRESTAALRIESGDSRLP
jgi:LacI family transcriptional regulator